jgi:hypothetical protein
MKIWLFLLLALTLASAAAVGQVKLMPGNVARGERVLEQKGCLSCHSLNGKGGQRAVDFANPTGLTNKVSGGDVEPQSVDVGGVRVPEEGGPHTDAD